MKKYSIMLVGTLFLSCSTLNKEAGKVKNEVNSNLEQSNQLFNKSSVVKLATDSSDVDEEVVFWPKGIVKYSTANGFEGELIKMSVRKKDKRQVLREETLNEMALVTQNLKVKQQEKGVLQTTLKKKQGFNFFGYGLASFILLLSVAYLFYKRKFVYVK